MGDRGYEGDPGYLAHLGSAVQADRWDVGLPVRASGDEVAAGVAQRLQARLDRHLRLLEQLRAEPLYPEPAGLPELQDTARRMRRDVERLLLLCGQRPAIPAGGPRPLADLVADAAAGAEEARRVEVRAVPAAKVAPAAAVEFVHVLTELVDHVGAAYPGARIELAGRLEGDGRDGVTVDALVEGALRHDPDGPGGRQAAAAAEQLARRSGHGIALRRPPTGAPPTGSGLVGSVHCPAAAVTVEEPPRPELPEPVLPAPASSFSGYGNGLPYHPNGSLGGTTGGALGGSAADPLGGSGNGSRNGTPLAGANGATVANGAEFDGPSYSPSSSSQVDELFGPLLDLPLEPIDDRYATPIFEAIASAWFREDADGGAGSGAGRGDRDPLDWETPQDDEWREAAARAARSEPQPTTSTGLPRRRPGNQLVPPRPAATQNSGSAERVPDRVRDRLSTYQRGLREGRHRADGAESDL